MKQDRCVKCRKQMHRMGANTCYPCNFKDGIKKGQADLIEKLTGKDAVEAACEYWYSESELTDADTWQEVGNTTQNDYREMFKAIIEKAIKAASESAGSVVASGEPETQTKAKSVAPENACPICKKTGGLGFAREFRYTDDGADYATSCDKCNNIFYMSDYETKPSKKKEK